MQSLLGKDVLALKLDINEKGNGFVEFTKDMDPYVNTVGKVIY